MVALQQVPAVVLAAGVAGRQDVDLLPRALPDVPDEQVAGQTVEAEAARVAQAERPDLRTRVGANEGIARRDGVCQPHVRLAVDVDPEGSCRAARSGAGRCRTVTGATAVPRADVR